MAETSFKLNLDSADFIQKASQAADAIKGVGKTNEQLTGLMDGLKSLGEYAGILGASYLTFKTVLDEVFQAENIKQVNAQFELLTKNAGLSTLTLKEGLEKSAQGLATDTELLEAANRSIIELGGSAQKIPQLMDLARKATAVFGGDLVSNFNAMSEAVATGNTRLLKHLGIIIDSQKALRDYAVSHNTVVEALSREEQQAAILNAVIEKGQTAFKGINTDLKENFTLWQQIKTATKEVGDAIALLADKIFGGVLKTALTGVNNALKDFNLLLKDKFGEGADQAQAHSKRLANEYDELNKKLQELDKTGQTFFNGTLVKKGTQQGADAVKAMQARVAALHSEIEKTDAVLKKSEEESKSATGPKAPAQDTAKRLEAEQKFNQELNALRAQRIDAELKEAHTIQEADRLHAEKRALIEQEFINKKKQIDTKFAKGEIADKKKHDKLIDQLEKTKKKKIETYERELQREHKQAMDNMVSDSENAADGMANAFKAASEEAGQSLTDWGAQGQATVESFKAHSTEAFLAVGAGSKTMADAMRGMFLNVIADKAQAYGAELLLEGIWPPNPLALGAGAALIALAGVLRAEAGGGPKGVSVPASGGGGMVPVTATQQTPTIPETQAGQAVTINVQGHYFETEQTKTALMDMVRSSTDATSFKYVQIGQT